MHKITKWIIVTQDHSGLGWAKLILDTPGTECILATRPKEDEDNLKAFNKVGDGIVQKIPLDQIMKQRSKYKEWGFLWDQNHNSDDAEKLRSEGFNVLGGHRFTDWLEHNREFGVSLVERAGLATPPTQEFDDILSGLDFLEANPDKAYVFKPDEPDSESWVTTTPDQDNDIKANEEMRRFLSSQKQGKGKYILQERKKGVEINVEMWLYKGKPYFANANFECKRKDNHDLGRMIGCAQDVGFVIPLGSKVLNETLFKLIAQPEFKDYTGMIDMNLIVSKKEFWFLEFCGRFGYNSHPNLFLSLALSPAAEIFSDMVTGNVADFGRHFDDGFGASIVCWIDKPVAGLPISFDSEETLKSFYHFDTTFDGQEYFLAGYANEAGIITAHDFEIKSAAEEVIKQFNKIHYPGRTGRSDLAQDDYISNPRERYEACEAMRLFQS
jgi:phosphoribosylamine-glycine ligase